MKHDRPQQDRSSHLRLAGGTLTYLGHPLDGALEQFHYAVDLLEGATCFGREVAWTSGAAPPDPVGCVPGQPCRRHKRRQRRQAGAA